MRSAKAFIDELATIVEKDKLTITVELYGSLAATGKGHYTDRASILGLCGYDPKLYQRANLKQYWNKYKQREKIKTPVGEIKFDLEKKMLNLCHKLFLIYQVNGMKNYC